MPSFGDTAIIALIALLLFGPKKLPELARQLGKLMAEFRRASNEFKMQMEDELRISEQEEQQKKIAAMQAAAPVTPPLVEDTSVTADDAQAPVDEPIGEVAPVGENSITAPEDTEPAPVEAHEPLPIASSGELNMMPPSTGLPVSRDGSASSLSPMLDAIPHADEPEPPQLKVHEESLHG